MKVDFTVVIPGLVWIIYKLIMDTHCIHVGIYGLVIILVFKLRVYNGLYLHFTGK